MSVLPLFVASMTALTAALRLDGAPNAQPLIETAVQEVRVGFYDALGATRVAEIVAMTAGENPTGDNALTRLRACNIEILWVRLRLLRTLPMLFQDAGASATQAWNEAGMTRGMSATEISKEIERLTADINTGLGILSGDEDAGVTVSATVIGPTCPNEAPGTGIYLGRQGAGSLLRRVMV